MPPLVIALVAGGLSVTNPCGFALMPAFLSLYVSADERNLPSARSRIAQGLVVGAAVSVGMISVFAVVGLPVVYGAVRFTRAIPWAGLAVGAVLVLAGIGLLAGRHLSLSLHSPVRLDDDRSLRTMVLFGAGYGVASLGCTLPVFLATVGASLATRGGIQALAVLTAYAGGMFVVVMALALGAALARHGLQKRLRRLLPRMQGASGGLLLLTGIYISYYWARVLFGSAATLSDDPIVGTVERIVSTIQRTAASGTGLLIVIAAIAIVAGAAASLWHLGRSRKEGVT